MEIGANFRDGAGRMSRESQGSNSNQNRQHKIRFNGEENMLSGTETQAIEKYSGQGFSIARVEENGLGYSKVFSICKLEEKKTLLKG